MLNINLKEAEIQKNLSTGQIHAGSLAGLLKSIDLSGINKNNFSVELKMALARTLCYLKADHGYIMLSGKEGELEKIAAIFNANDQSPVTANDALMQRTMKSGETIYLEDISKSHEFRDNPNFQRYNIASVICAAIKTQDRIMGVIYLESGTPDKWDLEQVELAEFVGMYIALALSSFKEKRLAEAGRATLNLSHSVKNILQMVGGAAEVIDYGLSKNQIPRVKKSWDILMPNLQRLRKFMLDMLDYSKERKLEPAACDFNRVITSAIESLKSQLTQKGSRIDLKIDKKIPTIELDPERIHEMSLNIILNAIDIVDHDTGVVKVSTKYLKDKNAVQLCVADNGPGMSDEMKTKIFTPFESGNNKFGTGLGMPIAKRIADQHKGWIEVESEPGKGAAFKVTLPAKVLNESPGHN